MKEFTVTITRTVVSTVVLRVQANGPMEAEVKATVGGLHHVLEKEGVELVQRDDPQSTQVAVVKEISN